MYAQILWNLWEPNFAHFSLDAISSDDKFEEKVDGIQEPVRTTRNFHLHLKFVFILFGQIPQMVSFQASSNIFQSLWYFVTHSKYYGQKNNCKSQNFVMIDASSTTFFNNLEISRLFAKFLFVIAFEWCQWRLCEFQSKLNVFSFPFPKCFVCRTWSFWFG